MSHMSQHEDSDGGGWTARLAILAIIAGALVLFIAMNFVTVEVRFFVAKVETRLAWALLVAAALGFVAGLLLPRIWRGRR